MNWKTVFALRTWDGEVELQRDKVDLRETLLLSSGSWSGFLLLGSPKGHIRHHLLQSLAPASEPPCQLLVPGRDWEELSLLMEPWYLVVEIARTSSEQQIVKAVSSMSNGCYKLRGVRPTCRPTGWLPYSKTEFARPLPCLSVCF